MAKKASKKKASKKKASAKKSRAGSSSAAVYLIKQTQMGSQLTPEDHQADMDRIHDHIKRAGGTCSLFGNRAKDANEFVSIIRGLSSARLRRMTEVIEKGGDVVASRLHILKGGP